MRFRHILLAFSAILVVTLFLGIVLRRSIPENNTSVDQQPLETLHNDITLPKPDAYHVTLTKLKKRAEQKAVEYTEAQREAWKENFPWKPTRDPDVVITQEIIDSNYAEAVLENHGFLKAFFENEARFTPQFQKFYEIVSEYGRDDNPVAIGHSFQNLWDLHEALSHDPAEIETNADGTPVTYIEPWETKDAQKPVTYEVLTRKLWGSIGSFLHDQSDWPEKDPEQLPPPEIQKVIYRLFTEVRGMDSIPDPRFVINGGYLDELQVGDSPLVPRVGWQAAHDKWNEEVQDQPFGFAYLVDPKGESHAMLKDADGGLISPLSAEQIEQINNGQ